MADKISIEILEDGTMKITTDAVSMPNHGNAELLIKEMIKTMGGESVRTKKLNVNSSLHDHDHDGHYHSH